MHFSQDFAAEEHPSSAIEAKRWLAKWISPTDRKRAAGAHRGPRCGSGRFAWKSKVADSDSVLPGPAFSGLLGLSEVADIHALPADTGHEYQALIKQRDFIGKGNAAQLGMRLQRQIVKPRRDGRTAKENRLGHVARLIQVGIHLAHKDTVVAGSHEQGRPLKPSMGCNGE